MTSIVLLEQGFPKVETVRKWVCNHRGPIVEIQSMKFKLSISSNSLLNRWPAESQWVVWSWSSKFGKVCPKFTHGCAVFSGRTRFTYVVCVEKRWSRSNKESIRTFRWEFFFITRTSSTDHLHELLQDRMQELDLVREVCSTPTYRRRCRNKVVNWNGYSC